MTRIISGMVCIIIAIVILVINNPIVDSIFITIVALAALYEFYKAYKKININPISFIGYILCIPILLIGTNILENNNILLLMLPIIIVISLMCIVASNLKRNSVDIAVTILGIVYIPFLLSFVKLIALMDNGRILIWYVLIGAFVCDMAAYFIGKNFGKHKLCPKISPNKTIEGSIAGIVTVIIAYVIFTICINNYAGINLPLWYMIIAGLISSIVGQFGDLFASIVKRQCGIKDFSNAIPGHGGILDRFDSIIFVSPVIYVLLQLILMR